MRGGGVDKVVVVALLLCGLVLNESGVVFDHIAPLLFRIWWLSLRFYYVGTKLGMY